MLSGLASLVLPTPVKSTMYLQGFRFRVSEDELLPAGLAWPVVACYKLLNRCAGATPCAQSKARGAGGKELLQPASHAHSRLGIDQMLSHLVSSDTLIGSR